MIADILFSNIKLPKSILYIQVFLLHILQIPQKSQNLSFDVFIQPDPISKINMHSHQMHESNFKNNFKEKIIMKTLCRSNNIEKGVRIYTHRVASEARG